MARCHPAGKRQSPEQVAGRPRGSLARPLTHIPAAAAPTSLGELSPSSPPATPAICSRHALCPPRIPCSLSQSSRVYREVKEWVRDLPRGGGRDLATPLVEQSASGRVRFLLSRHIAACVYIVNKHVTTSEQVPVARGLVHPWPTQLPARRSQLRGAPRSWPAAYALPTTRAAVVERLACSPPTGANRAQSSVRITPGFYHVGIVPDDAAVRRGFLGDLPFRPPLHPRRCSILITFHPQRLRIIPDSKCEGISRVRSGMPCPVSGAYLKIMLQAAPLSSRRSTCLLADKGRPRSQRMIDACPIRPSGLVPIPYFRGLNVCGCRCKNVLVIAFAFRRATHASGARPEKRRTATMISGVEGCGLRALAQRRNGREAVAKRARPSTRINPLGRHTFTDTEDNVETLEQRARGAPVSKMTSPTSKQQVGTPIRQTACDEDDGINMTAVDTEPHCYRLRAQGTGHRVNPNLRMGVVKIVEARHIN
ncbi:hypothetical protein PR048_003538 [Dryococelus australis]|uniref:Uncharacterized protein n=1 Tax=Dryococelus australis TaxID=614101 RepID=A0ABQ9IQ91_9NEOP|nr:hypothetical protein PR048_003538 [Dryococelus australis]